MPYDLVEEAGINTRMLKLPFELCLSCLMYFLRGARRMQRLWQRIGDQSRAAQLYGMPAVMRECKAK